MVYSTHFCKSAMLLLSICCVNVAFAQEDTLKLSIAAKTRYYGACDGSAAIRIDDNTQLVANDETNLLNSYAIWGGHPVSIVDLNNMLVFKKPREIDIEAVAISGNRLWWAGSHGRNNNSKKRSNRRKLFATNIPNRNLDDLVITDGPYDLMDALQNT